MATRLGAALRLVARMRLALLATAGVGLGLMLLLALTAAIAGAVAAVLVRVLPAAWPVAPVVAVLGLVAFAAVAAMVLGFLAAGVRALVLFTAEPPSSSPLGVVGTFGGLGLFLLGRRLRAGRGLLGWVRDPLGAAARAALTRTLPPDHPLLALMAMAGLEPRRAPTRGPGWMALGIVALGAAVALAVGAVQPAWGDLALVLLAPLAVWAATLAAAARGALAGAWDRVLLAQVGAQAAQTVAGLAEAVGRGPVEPGYPTG